MRRTSLLHQNTKREMIVRASSHMLTSSGPAHLQLPQCVGRATLASIMQMARDRVSSPALKSQGQFSHNVQVRVEASSEQPPDINMSPGDNPNQGNLPGFWW